MKKPIMKKQINKKQIKKKTAKRPVKKKAADRATITISVMEPKWRTRAKALTSIRRAARIALADGQAFLPAKARRKGALKFTLLLAGDARMKALNHEFRGQRTPTNVLSFPSADGDYLGDIVMAYGVVAAEARAQKKPFYAHAAHLAAHGVLHLLGYDHLNDDEAALMEGLEVRLLARLGLPDPYAADRRG